MSQCTHANHFHKLSASMFAHWLHHVQVPASQQAADALNALWRDAASSGVDVNVEAPLVSDLLTLRGFY